MIRQASVVVLLLGLCIGQASADVGKASDWIDRVVVTSDGELLGRVEDFAIDTTDLSVRFVVVAVGSFLIDDNLIAVAPDALEVSPSGEYLVAYADGLESARRFGSNTWPSAPDVLASAERGSPPTDVEVPDSSDEPGGFEEDGVATISDGRRTAMIRSGERSMSVEHDQDDAAPESMTTASSSSEGEPDATKLPLPSFATLDGNGDGQLDRREIGARLGRTESFTELDLDESGAIDSFEFDLLKSSRPER
jgi:sporulation protein YlmC with PRC-barrel domain